MVLSPHARLQLFVYCAAIGTASAAEPVTPTPSLWRNPGRVEALDFTGGPGGRARAPRPPFTFISEDTSGSTPKVTVRDARNARWTVKWGEEARPEVFASRLAWATGYYAEPTYFVPRGRIRGARKLARADQHIAKNGLFRNARFELRDPAAKFRHDIGWSWEKNPFRGTHQLNGLKIIVMLTSNWDNKDGRDATSNTGILEHRVNGRPRWTLLVTDWGATMGQWGGFFTREKWDCDEYREQTADFVRIDDGELEWGFRGQHDGNFKDDLTVADVRWIMQYLGRITNSQLRAGLRAAGASPHEVNCFTRSVRARIEMLRRVPRARAPRVMRARTAG
jgi:hypothetical protein